MKKSFVPIVFLLSFSFLFARPVKVSPVPAVAKNYTDAQGRLIVFHDKAHNYGILGVFHKNTRLMAIFEVKSYNKLRNSIISYLNRPFEAGNATLYKGKLRAKHTINKKSVAYENIIIVVQANNSKVSPDELLHERDEIKPEDKSTPESTDLDNTQETTRRTISFHFFDVTSGKPREIKELGISLEAISKEALSGEDQSALEIIRRAFVKI